MERNAVISEESSSYVHGVQIGAMNIDQDIQQSVGSTFFKSPQKARENLLDGFAPLFIASSVGTQFDYSHQCAAAKGIVDADRTRQLLEQSAHNNRPFAIEFPAQALAAASLNFKQGYDADPTVSHVDLNLGTVLPGYAMCVLDWYGKALRSKKWHHFVPDNPSIEGDDKWYWVYCYSAMRSLGMAEFATHLQVFIEGMLCSLSTDIESYVHLVRTLSPDDPLIRILAEHTAHQMLTQSLLLTEADCQAVAEHFPQFAELVNEAMKGC